MEVILTAAVTINGMIARKATEHINWSADLSLFRKQTMNQTVVIGSTTKKTLQKELEGRNVLVIHRDMEAEKILAEVSSKRCFIIGGSRIYSIFAPFLTHLYITSHPLVFKSNAIPLFSNLQIELNLSFIRKIPVDEKKGIYQLQYKVVNAN